MDEERYALLQSKYVAEREKVAKLEGWLKALVPYIERSGLYDDLIKEVYAYIKAMEPPCPCTIGTPCTYACSCANPVMSGGCDRCDKFKRAMEGK